jgi:hypothetical protein
MRRRSQSPSIEEKYRHRDGGLRGQGQTNREAATTPSRRKPWTAGSRPSRRAPGFPTLTATAAYRAVTTGFAVTPRLAGSQVLIDVEPWSDRLGSGRSGVINTQSAHTLDSRIFLKVEDLDAGKP